MWPSPFTAMGVLKKAKNFTRQDGGWGTLILDTGLGPSGGTYWTIIILQYIIYSITVPFCPELVIRLP